MCFGSEPDVYILYTPKNGSRELREHTGEVLFWAVSILILSSGFTYWPLFMP